MYLKKLEILGFKSFSDKTTIKFSEGVTAIVGPNGCGKTNVLDALRWVLGEQKPTMLRGGKMEEVIFNGTRDAKPLGMADVTLTVVNDRGVLATEYNEVQITRRLFRSGESEYMLNKIPCRLKDITDLFVDTGMGAHSYSVIQQDMIDAVISDKAEERRFLFEEAAGITKYKQRRKAALRKLEATEHDLLRLKDIYIEVKTRVNSLYRQHKKAERYQRVTDEIKGWELYLGARRVRVMSDEKRNLMGSADSLSSNKIAKETELDRHAAQLEVDRKELIDIEHRLNEIGSKIYELTEESHNCERELSVLSEKKTNAETLINRNSGEIVSLQERLERLATQLSDNDTELQQYTNVMEEVANRLRQAEQVQTHADEQLLQARSGREAENRRLVELEGRLSSGITEESGLRQQSDELQTHLTDVTGQLDNIRPRQAELISRLDSAKRHLDELLSSRSQTERRRHELTERINNLTETGEDLSGEIADLNASVEACEARKMLLEEMIVSYEGHESGVVVAMEERDRWPEIIGTVTEKFVPVQGMEAALEGALGEMARFLICRSRATADSIIAYLRRESQGKIGILVPDTGAINPGVKRPDVNVPGVVGWLDSYVSTDDNLHHLRDAILARTLVFEADTDPSAILERLPHGFTAVSTAGTVYGQNMVTGGSDDHFPLFRRQEKVKEEQKIIEGQRTKLGQLSEQKSQSVAELAAARGELNRLTDLLDELADTTTQAQKELAESEYETRSLTADVQRLERDRQAAAGKLEGMRHRQGTLELGSTQLTQQKESLVTSMEEGTTRVSVLEQQAVAAMDTLSKVQIASIEARNKLEQTDSRISHLRELRRELDENLSTKKSEIERAESEIAYATSRSAELELSLKGSFEKREGVSSQQKELREVQNELMERVGEREKTVKQLRTDRDQVGDSLHDVQIKLNTIDSEVRSISERIQDEYEIDITRATAPSPDENTSDEEAPNRLSDLRDRLKKFGAVNLLALEEYREASDREKFLSEQLADLDKAKADLNSTIGKINQTARQLFSDTLSKVQENFKRLFVELFNGGEASIQLVNPDDPLESDIEIVARPRGKKLLSITMMSGGERALTAISLLFSLYLVKPSPFCILDEIDAPLDDANCHRFLRIIRTFSDQTQFIVITHNKITMEAADNLYGITMELPGVSKMVAVRFADPSGNDKVRLDISQDDEPSDIALPESIQNRISPEVGIKPTDDA